MLAESFVPHDFTKSPKVFTITDVVHTFYRVIYNSL